MAFDDSKSTFGTFDDRAVWLVSQLLADFPALDPDGAYAIAGNLGAESLIEMVQEGGQTPPNGGWGLAQWTGPRRTAFNAYCARSGRDPDAMSTGYAYLFVELKGAYSKAIDALVATSGLENKVASFEKLYEGAGIVRMNVRTQLAFRAKAAWEAHLASVPAPTTTPAPAPPPGTTPPPVIIPAPTTTPAPTKGTSMFSIGSLISLISSAPSIIEGVMKLISEVEAGYAKGKAAGGDPVVIFEDILAALVANKGAVASAVLGPEPSVNTAGAIVAAPKVAVK